MRFTFFHAADLHLGAASEGVMRGAPDAVSEAVRSSTYRAFENLILDAEAQRPAFVLFAGDLYNAADENLRARLAFRDGVARLDKLGIQSFVIRGNHDYHTGNDTLRLPSSCHVFEAKPGEPRCAELRGEPIARIYGESYPSFKVVKNLAEKYPRVIRGEDGLLQIAMLHGNLIGERSLGSDENNPNDYAPFGIADLERGGYDYWALGHVHGHKVVTQGAFWAVYTGSLQGVSPRERGAKGYYWVEGQDARVTTVEFREADVLRWDEKSIDLSGMEFLNEVQVAIDSAVRQVLTEAGERPVIARLVLFGSTVLNAQLREEGFADFMESLRAAYAAESPFFWIESWVVETRQEIDWESIRRSESVQGYLMRLADGSEPDFLSSIPAKLKALAGRTRFEMPSAEDIQEALGRAAEQAVTLLRPETDE